MEKKFDERLRAEIEKKKEIEAKRITVAEVKIPVTKKGKRWNARAVRDVLTNEIYTGKYKVASVEARVEEYRIIDDGLYEKAAEITRRFTSGMNAERPPMPEDRRRAKIERVFNEYLEFLKKK